MFLAQGGSHFPISKRGWKLICQKNKRLCKCMLCAALCAQQWLASVMVNSITVALFDLSPLLTFVCETILFWSNRLNCGIKTVLDLKRYLWFKWNIIYLSIQLTWYSIKGIDVMGSYLLEFIKLIIYIVFFGRFMKSHALV